MACNKTSINTNPIKSVNTNAIDAKELAKQIDDYRIKMKALHDNKQTRADDATEFTTSEVLFSTEAVYNYFVSHHNLRQKPYRYNLTKR